MAKARFQPQLPPQHSGASFADLGESASTSHDVGATLNQASPADLDHFQWLKHDFSRSFPHSTPGPRLRIWANQRLLRTMWVPPPTKPPLPIRTNYCLNRTISVAASPTTPGQPQPPAPAPTDVK